MFFAVVKYSRLTHDLKIHMNNLAKITYDIGMSNSLLTSQSQSQFLLLFFVCNQLIVTTLFIGTHNLNIMKIVNRARCTTPNECIKLDKNTEK
jgi:hypothetical protein